MGVGGGGGTGEGGGGGALQGEGVLFTLFFAPLRRSLLDLSNVCCCAMLIRLSLRHGDQPEWPAHTPTPLCCQRVTILTKHLQPFNTTHSAGP
jgi:hypothetical protein